jgi:hypothetical protein
MRRCLPDPKVEECESRSHNAVRRGVLTPQKGSSGLSDTDYSSSYVLCRNKKPSLNQDGGGMQVAAIRGTSYSSGDVFGGK